MEYAELDPINIVMKSADGKLEVVFKKTGHCDVWEKPPEGYRYASALEVLSVGFPDDRIGTLAFENEKWKFFRYGQLVDFNNSVETLTSSISIFQGCFFFIALIKL